MKKILSVTFILIFGFSFHVYGQHFGELHNGFPGIHQIIAEYGEQLNLSDDQKSELIAIQLDRRQNIRANRVRNQRTDRPGMRSHRGSMRNTDERNNQVSEMTSAYFEKVNEVLTDTQEQILRSLLIDKVHQNRELQILQNNEILSRAGIEGENAIRVLEILNRQSEAAADLAVYRIENPDESVREKLREFAQLRRDGLNEMKQFLTATEFENLQQMSRFSNQGRQSTARRFLFRSR